MEVVTQVESDAHRADDNVLVQRHRVRASAGLLVIVCLMSAGAGVLCGSLAGTGYSSRIWAEDWMNHEAYKNRSYEPFEPISMDLMAPQGRWLGGGGGGLVGWVWCRIMFSHSRRKGRAGVVGTGTCWGMAAGVASTIFLHIPLMEATGNSYLGIGLVCGLVTGALVGVICGGLLCLLVVPAAAGGTGAESVEEFPNRSNTVPSGVATARADE